ncbi:carboxypeptidase regulatory-like domain-containing protein [Acidobacteria bacterium AH-259-G07]|nr:carboxypeptidase regulatory-like domain-containing protein [Acidobacteria bacterium AH-259-G07]
MKQPNVMLISGGTGAQNQRTVLAKAVLISAALLILMAGSLSAQTTASIFGTVTDQTTAVVPGTEISATNTLTNEVRRTLTNNLGYYSFPELPVGVYTVQATLPGFKTALRGGIQLSLNRNAKVDIELTVGETTDNVTVLGDAPLVESTTNEMGSLVDQRRIVDLPLNGRNTLSLVSLIPGAQQLKTGNAQGFVENKVNINGLREEQSNWLLDGVDNTSPLRNYGNDVPNPDAIQEFRVITNNYGAEYGRSVGAVVNVITRSGSNEYHGSLFHFHRNRALNARNFFQPDTTPLVQNQFGGTFGGPIIKDKSFFFGSYQGFRRKVNDFKNSALVPTGAERAGDFSKSVDRKGNPVKITDPLTDKPFPNSIIPPERVSQVALNYLDLAVPLPNFPANGPNGLSQSAGEARDNDQFLVKIDHHFSENHTLSGAYFWSDSADEQRFVKEIDFAARTIKTRQHNFNIHEYWTISPTKLNHFRATFSRSAGNRKVTPDDVSINDLGGNFSPLPVGPQMPPDFDVKGYFDAGSAFGGPKVANHYILADTFSWTRGRHDFKFGVEGWLRRLTDVSTAPRMGGEFVFDGSFTGNSAADLMLGLVDKLTYGIQSYKSNNSWAFYGFGQDKFRVTPKLVLTLGLRYELDTWPVHPLDQLITYRAGRQSSCVPQASEGILFPCDDGIARAGIDNDLNNFAPRFGFAYDLLGDGKTIVRAGYGISYAFTVFNVLQGGQVSIPFALRETLRDTTLEDPYAPIGGSPFPFNKDLDNLKFPAKSSYSFQNPDMRTGYVQQWNLSIQRQIGNDWSAEVAYVGNAGRKLLSSLDINSPLRAPDATKKNIDQRRPLWPTFKQMQQNDGFVNSSYHAFQARVEKRFSRGFTLLGSYTLSKWIDDESWHSSRSRLADQRNFRLNRGLGEEDRRQMFILSWLWDLPSFSQWSGPARAILGGWSVNGIATFYAGIPVRLRSNKDNDFDGNSSGDRPDVVGDWKLSPNRSRNEVIQAWFNADAFEPNQPGQLGNAGRNFMIGPGSKNFDFALSKDVRISESHRVQFRAEMFNGFNWVNLGSPEGRVNRSTFGKIRSAGSPRIFQFGLKYIF